MKVIDEDWVFRYRSMSSLSLKELMYNEIYFSYPDELNDPLDLEAELIVPAGCDFVIEYFISGALKSINFPRPKEISDLQLKFSKSIAKICASRTFNIGEFLTQHSKEWLEAEYRKAELEPFKFEGFYSSLINSLSNLFPSNLQSASFSESCLNPLLWSVYADKHSGFSLIFDPNEKQLRLSKYMDTEKKEFLLEPVDYSSDISVDLSLMFNESKEFDYKCLSTLYFPSLSKKALLTKNSNWHKENELRIHLGVNASFSHRESDVERMTPVEKTYNYDVAQLVGVIYGYKMQPKDREEIKKIFEVKKQNCYLFEAIPQGNDMAIGYLGGMGFYD